MKVDSLEIEKDGPFKRTMLASTWMQHSYNRSTHALSGWIYETKVGCLSFFIFSFSLIFSTYFWRMQQHTSPTCLLGWLDFTDRNTIVACYIIEKLYLQMAKWSRIAVWVPLFVFWHTLSHFSNVIMTHVYVCMQFKITHLHIAMPFTI